MLQADAFKKPNMIDEARMEKYLSAIRKERKNLAENVSKDEILELMGITSDGVPTLAGLMVFSKYPQGYISLSFALQLYLFPEQKWEL